MKNWPKHQTWRGATTHMAGVMLASCLFCLMLPACKQSKTSGKDIQKEVPPAESPANIAAREREERRLKETQDRKEIEAFCGACHALDKPEAFTMHTWGRAIDYMYRLFEDERVVAQNIIPKERVMDYFRRNAARVVPAPQTYPLYEGARRFRRENLGLAVKGAIISNMAHTGRANRKRVVVADMVSGQILRLDGATYSEPRVLVKTDHPARVVEADLDGDGRLDLLVAELGTFLAVDDVRGKAVWFRKKRGAGYERIILSEGLGRVSDVRAADVDGDGDLDVMVAEFGWQKTGNLLLLERVGGKGSKLTFKKHVVEPGHGATRVEAADFDGDGDLDIVAMFSQAIEAVVVYENMGGLRFEKRPLFKGSTPLWGMIGMELVDIDGDGDLDVLHFNGDNLDSPKLAEFQGVYLLRNDGALKFTPSKLATLPGTHDVAAGDLDGDGDTDLVAVASLPPLIEATASDAPVAPHKLPRTDAVLFIENVGKVGGQTSFVVSAIEKSGACHSAVLVDDPDGDGDADILLGSFRLGWEILNHDLSGQGGPAMSARCAGGYDLVLLHNEDAAATNAPRSTGPVERRLTHFETKAALEEQVEAYQRLIDTHPENALFPNRLGKLFHTLGRLPEALTVLREASRRAPEHEAVWSNLGTTLNNLRQFEAALKAADEAVKLAPEYAPGHSVRAVSLSQLGRTQEAVDAGKRSVELDPRHFPYRVNLANFLLFAGAHKEALTELDAAEKIMPGNPMVAALTRRVRELISGNPSGNMPPPRQPQIRPGNPGRPGAWGSPPGAPASGGPPPTNPWGRRPSGR